MPRVLRKPSRASLKSTAAHTDNYGAGQLQQKQQIIKDTAIEYASTNMIGMGFYDGVDCEDGYGNCRRARRENGLVELTKKFIDLLKEADN